MSDDLLEDLRASVAEARAAEHSGGSDGGNEVGASGGEPVAIDAGGGDTGDQQGDPGAHTDQPSKETGVGGQRTGGADGPGRTRDAAGKFIKGEATQTKAPTPGAKALVKPSPVAAKSTVSPPTQAAGQTTSTSGPPALGSSSVSELKAPQSWKAEVRAKWDALPPEVQQEVSKRERETEQGLAKNADAAKFREQFQQTLAPYQAMLGNADPIRAAQSLFQTAHALNYAPAPQKAQLVAQIIKQYGVDIEQLASHLDGAPAPTQQQQPQIDPEQLAQQIEARIQKQWEMRQTQSQVTEFKKDKEFLTGEYSERIQKRMGALLGQGIATDLEDAYNQACWADSEVRSFLQQRERAQLANANAASTQRAKAASSSVRSQPAPAPPGQQLDRTEDILREELAKARRGT